MKKDEFRVIWWEMEAIEPLTPLTLCNETNEVPAPVRQTKEERVCNSESHIL